MTEWKPIDSRPKENVPIVVGEWIEQIGGKMIWSIWAHMSNDPKLNSCGRSYFYQPEMPEPPPIPAKRASSIYTGILRP